METELHSLIHDLATRVATLEAEREASGLMHRYAALLDAPVPESLASLFASGGELRTSRGTYRGRDEITGFFRNARSIDPSEKRHFICQPRVTTGESGLVVLECYFGYTSRTDRSSGIGWGTYAAEIRATNADALFESLTIDLHMGTDLEQGWPI
ncbi:MAG: nuclear transport factor 2 family protein [Rhodococcus sp. (in: high G+C Gram-positive bacteria)]